MRSIVFVQRYQGCIDMTQDYWLQEKNGIYHVRFRINGIEKSGSTKHRDVKAAYREAPKVIARIKKKMMAKEMITFGHLIARFIKWSKAHKITWKDDMYMLKYIMQYIKKEMALDDVSPVQIQMFCEQISKKKKSSTQSISGSRINKYLALIKKMFNMAIEWEIYNKRNPVRKSHFYKVPPLEERVFNAEEVERIFKASVEFARNDRSKNIRIFPMFLLTAFTTACRYSELLNMKVTDIQGQFIKLHRTKTNRKRTVPITIEIKHMLENLPREGEYVFDVTRRKSDVFRKVWNKVKEMAGIEATARFHTFRHSNTTALLHSGTDIRTVQAIGGWSRLDMLEVVEDHYGEDK